MIFESSLTIFSKAELMKKSVSINYIEFEERTAYDLDLQKELFFVFLHESKRYHDLLLYACKKKDMSLVYNEIHKATSSFRLMGFDELAENLQNVEENNLSFDYIEKRINTIFEELSDLTILLQKYLESKSQKTF